MTRKPSVDLSRRSLLLGGMLVATSATAAALQLRVRFQRPLHEDLGDQIPRAVGQWNEIDGGEVVRPPEAAATNRYDQEVSRVYATEGMPGVMLMIAYGTTQSDTLQVHRPEFCYPASGFSLGESQKVRQPVGSSLQIPATFFTAVRGDRVEQVLYWVRLGKHFPTSWLQQHLARLEDRATGVVPDGILVRASVIDPDAQASKQLLSGFLEQLVQRSGPAAHRALLG